MKYKVGNKVRIKSIDWYNLNKGPLSKAVELINGPRFIEQMSCFCNKIMTITDIKENVYRMKEDDSTFDWTDDMIEGIVEEIKLESKFYTGDIVYSTTWQRNVIILEILPNGFYKVGDIHGSSWFKTHETFLCKEKIDIPYQNIPNSTELIKHEISLPDGYIFKDDSGNVINTTKIVLEKKNKYPKTYEECCKILNCAEHYKLALCYYTDKFDALYHLLICRDAYWKIAGWKPVYEAGVDNDFYCIYTFNGEIYKTSISHRNALLAFPTAEMRDAFYENFKELIELVKELL